MRDDRLQRYYDKLMDYHIVVEERYDRTLDPFSGGLSMGFDVALTHLLELFPEIDVHEDETP